MPIPSTMADLSLTAANNSPQGTDPIGNTLDDYLRSIQAILRSTNALAPASIASASTTDIGSAAAESVEITGTTTITSFGTAPAGIRRELRFTGSLTITHSSSIQLPGAKNWQTAPGDVLTFRSLGSGQWIMTGHQSLDASRLTGTLDPARVPQGAVTQHQDALSISASQITSGTLADARLSSNIPRLNASATITGTWTFTGEINAPSWINVASGFGMRTAYGANLFNDGAHWVARSASTTPAMWLQNVNGENRCALTEQFGSFGLLDSTDNWALRVASATRLLNNINEFTYGTFYIQGGRNGHVGLILGDGIHSPTFTTDGNLIGIYCQSGPRDWLFYDTGSDFRIRHKLVDMAGQAYLKSNFSSANVTISTSGPSGGADGDIWLQVV